MPRMVKDGHSGAVLFVSTPEEKKAREMEDRVGKLEDILLKIAEGEIDPKMLKETIKKK